MGIAGGGLDLRVAEQLADHRQAPASGDRRVSEGVAQVMDADILDAGMLAKPWKSSLNSETAESQSPASIYDKPPFINSKIFPEI